MTEYVRVCPVCDTENPPSAARCRCGASLAAIDFSVRREPAPAAPDAAPVEPPAAADAAAVACPYPDCAQPNPPGQSRCVYCNRPLEPSAPPLAPPPPPGARPLPEALRDRYRVLELFPVSGSEADIMLVADVAGGERSVVKLYRHGVQPDFRLLEILSRTVGDAVVRVLDHGVSEGVAYERLEYVPNGTLKDLLEAGPLGHDDVRRIVAEVADALNGIHAHGILHRDLKPENVLLRSTSPVELALTDFGIASLSEATQRFTSVARTTRYAAPEALTGVLDYKSDWWSLGMIALEAATGRHPFEGLTEHVMNHHLATRPIDVRGVFDERLRLLCRGLLLRDPKRRWGADEVARWLAGDPTLEIAADEGAGTAVTPYRIGAAECFDAGELALALAKHWDSARKDLARGQVGNWIERELHDHNLARKLHDIREHRDLSDDMRLLRLLRIVAPGLPPVWIGAPLGAAEIIDAARRAASGDAKAEAWLDSIAREDVLAQFPEDEALREIDARWQQSWTRFEAVLARARAHELEWRKTPRAVAGAGGAEVVSFDDVVFGAGQRLALPPRRDVNAALILADADPAYADAMRAEVVAALADVAGYCTWYEALYDETGDDPAALVVVHRLVRHARDDANREKDRLGASKEARERIVNEARADIAEALQAVLDIATGEDGELERRAREDIFDALEPLQRACQRASALGIAGDAAEALAASADRLSTVAGEVHDTLAGLDHAESVNRIFLRSDRLVFPAIFIVIVFVRSKLVGALLLAAFLLFAGYRVHAASRAREKVRSAWRALRGRAHTFMRQADDA